MRINRQHHRLHRHHRPQLALRVLAIGQRIGAVKRNTGAHPQVMRIRPAENTSRIGDRPLVVVEIQRLDIFDLGVGEGIVDVVRARQVRHHANAAQSIEIVQRIDQFVGPVDGKTEPPHAGIDFQPDVEIAQIAAIAQAIEVKLMVQHRIDAEADAGLQFDRGGKAAQNQDFLPDAGLSQRDRFADRGDRKGVGMIECARHFDRAVTVGIGLDDCALMLRDR
jgi:hypothetical protein